jgi:hypothetical protein
MALSRTIGPPGGAVVVRGTSCAAHSVIRIYFDGKQVATSTTDADANYRKRVYTPEQAPAGTHQVYVANDGCAGWTGGPFVVHTEVTMPGFDARNDNYDRFSVTNGPDFTQSAAPGLPSGDIATIGPVWTGSGNYPTGGGFYAYPDYSLLVADGARLRGYVNLAPTMDPASMTPTGIDCVEPHGRAFLTILGSDRASGTVLASVAHGIDAFHVASTGCTLLWSRSGLVCLCASTAAQGRTGFAFLPSDPNEARAVGIGMALVTSAAHPHVVRYLAYRTGKQLATTTIDGQLTAAAINPAEGSAAHPHAVIGTSTGHVYDVTLSTGTARQLTGKAGGPIESLISTPDDHAIALTGWGADHSRLVVYSALIDIGSITLTSPVTEPVSDGHRVYVVDGTNSVVTFSLSAKGLAQSWIIPLDAIATGRPLLTAGWLGVPTSTGVKFLNPATGAAYGGYIGAPSPVRSVVALDGALLLGLKGSSQWLINKPGLK